MKYLLYSLLLLLAVPTIAQDNQMPAAWCGTVFTEEMDNRLDRTLATLYDADYVRSNVTVYVPLKVWIVADDNGSNAYSKIKALERVCELNEQYEPQEIEFYLYDDELGYIENTGWNNGGSSAQSNLMPLFNKQSGAINCYIVNQAGYSPETAGGLCGYYTPGQDVVILQQNCLTPYNTTWKHELGHLLTLPHPFYGWEGTDYSCNTNAPNWAEKYDGSNCSSAGDRICDTPPDYLSSRWNCNNDGESNCVHKDANGDTGRADGTNTMGYSNDACATIFTADQGQAMRIDVNNRGIASTNNPNFNPISGVATLNSPVDLIEVENYASVDFSWNAVPNATKYIFQVSRVSSFSFMADEQVLTGNSYTSTVLEPNRTYNWRVMAYKATDFCQGFSASGIFKTTSSTAVHNVEGVNSFVVQPNPTRVGEALHLVLDTEKSMDASVRLFNVSGQLVKADNGVRFHAGTNNYDLNTNQLGAGIYMVSVTTDNGTLNRKVLVIE